MLKSAHDSIVQQLSGDSALQQYFKEGMGLKLTITSNPKEIVPPAGFLSLAGAEVSRGSNSSEASFSLLLLLPYFKDVGRGLEAIDAVMISLFNIKSSSGIVTSVAVGEMVPPVEDEPTWTVSLTVVVMI